MRSNFSERIGLKKARTELDKDKLPQDLRNSLWTVMYEKVFNFLSNDRGYMDSGHTIDGKTAEYSDAALFYRRLWIDFYKFPIDNLALANGKIFNLSPFDFIRKWFFDAAWNEVYELLEFTAESQGRFFTDACNYYLKRELSGYRFVNGLLVEINNQEEVVEIENALNISDNFKPVRTHLSTSLNLMANKKKPDFRNSIKESISAVESLCKIIIKNDTATLGEALKLIEKKHNIPNSLKAGFSSIYGYTSDKGGIRHGLLQDDIDVGIDEARFMLIACSAFINYLISKSNE
jgi:hypothetical protein